MSLTPGSKDKKKHLICSVCRLWPNPKNIRWLPFATCLERQSTQNDGAFSLNIEGLTAIMFCPFRSPSRPELLYLELLLWPYSIPFKSLEPLGTNLKAIVWCPSPSEGPCLSGPYLLAFGICGFFLTAHSAGWCEPWSKLLTAGFYSITKIRVLLKQLRR